jgi:hypothetical protein
MTNSFESSSSSTSKPVDSVSPGWLKLTVVAAASVLAGGLAATWWYRNAIAQLRQAEERPTNSSFGTPGDDLSDEA